MTFLVTSANILAQQNNQGNPLFALFGLMPCMCIPCFGLLGIAMTAFWIWMLVDCASNEPNTPSDNTKIIWILIIVLVHGLGALLYFLIRRPERKRLYGK